MVEDTSLSSMPISGETLFKIWTCVLCGLTYNEREGWPEDGIAAGTRWQDVPDDWVCPDCGTAKADFKMTEV